MSASVWLSRSRRFAYRRLRSSILPLVEALHIYTSIHKGCSRSMSNLWRCCFDKGLLWAILDEVLCRCMRIHMKPVSRDNESVVPIIQHHRSMAQSIKDFLIEHESSCTPLNDIEYTRERCGAFECLLPSSWHRYVHMATAVDPWTTHFFDWMHKTVPKNVDSVNRGDKSKRPTRLRDEYQSSPFKLRVHWKSVTSGVSCLDVPTRALMSADKGQWTNNFRGALQGMIPELCYQYNPWRFKASPLSRINQNCRSIYVLIDESQDRLHHSTHSLYSSLRWALKMELNPPTNSPARIKSTASWKKRSRRLHKYAFMEENHWEPEDIASARVGIVRFDRLTKSTAEDFKLIADGICSQECDVIILVVPFQSFHMELAGAIGGCPQSLGAFFGQSVSSKNIQLRFRDIRSRIRSFIAQRFIRTRLITKDTSNAKSHGKRSYRAMDFTIFHQEEALARCKRRRFSEIKSSSPTPIEDLPLTLWESFKRDKDTFFASDDKDAEVLVANEVDNSDVMSFVSGFVTHTARIAMQDEQFVDSLQRSTLSETVITCANMEDWIWKTKVHLKKIGALKRKSKKSKTSAPHKASQVSIAAQQI